MAQKGYLAYIKGQSSTIQLTDEPTTTTDDITYVLNDIILDINTPVEITDQFTLKTWNDTKVWNDTEQWWEGEPSGDFKVDYLAGTITFKEAQLRDITVTAKAVVLTEIASAKSYQLSLVRDVLDKTKFRMSHRQFKYGLMTGTASMTAFIEDTYFAEWLLDSSYKAVEFYIDEDKEPFRFYALVSQHDVNAPVEGLNEVNVNLQIVEGIANA
jgi:hypothetical protein